MDRRQRKTREAIFTAFTQLLSKKDFNHITVSEIIALADVGRATFYSHFESKDLLLLDLCKELFSHITDSEKNNIKGRKSIFDCDNSDAVLPHLFRHLQRNDNNILVLLSSQNNELFLQYFRTNLNELAENQPELFKNRKSANVPNSFWQNHVSATLVETIRWWIQNGLQESPEVITEYFFSVL